MSRLLAGLFASTSQALAASGTTAEIIFVCLSGGPMVYFLVRPCDIGDLVDFIFDGFLVTDTFLVSCPYRPYSIGDHVNLCGKFGIVHDITLFDTRLDTASNIRFRIPNSEIYGKVGRSTIYAWP